METTLDELIRNQLSEEGASLVAFADLSSLPEDIRDGMPVGIIIGAAINPAVVAGLNEGPTAAYEMEYNRLNNLLGELGEICASILRISGFSTIAAKPTQKELDWETLDTLLPHKTIATLAGVGWIGKCALLVTSEFGSALRITSVLTNAPLKTGTPISSSQCGECTDCVDICPANAPSGNPWSVRIKREEFFDAFACCETAWTLAREREIDAIICGRCIATCPWTKKYIGKLT